MSIIIQRESTEYIYIGVKGNAPTTADVAFLAAGIRPVTNDWHAASLITSNSNPLWADAVASGATGDYFVAILIGSFGGTGIVLTAADYQVWLRLTGTTEQPVRITPVALEVA